MPAISNSIVAAAAILLWSVAAAADDAPLLMSEGLPRTAAAYIFATNLSGDVGVAGTSLPLNLSSADLLRDVKMGGMGYFQWRRGNGFIYGEAVVVNYEARSFDQFFDQNLKGRIALYELGYGWNFNLLSRPGGGARFSVAPYLGARTTSIRVRANGPQVFHSARETWYDPVAGTIIEAPVRGKLTALAKLDAAGFGLADGKYLSVALMLRYAASKHWAMALGYRHVKATYEASGAEGIALDMRADGPQLGLQLSF